MNKQGEFFHRLADMFERFHSSVNIDRDSSCNNCFYCCSDKMQFPGLYPLEKDIINRYIDEHLPAMAVDDFEDYLLYGKLPVCPFYLTGYGCRIYNVRPLFCRIFGNVETDIPVPDFCIYKERMLKYIDMTEFLSEYKRLNVDYTTYKLSCCIDEEERFFLLIEKAIEHMLLYDFASGRDILLQALSIKDEDIGLYFYLGWACMEMKLFDESINYFIKALHLGAGEKLYKNSFEKQAFYGIYDKMSYVYYNLNEWDKSCQFCDKAIELRPGNISPYFTKYFIFFNKGSHIEAGEMLRTIKKEFPLDKEIQDMCLKFNI
jgi:tetratricopeptide (TPR) repeat protein